MAGETRGPLDAVRIGNCSGFYGDRLSAMHEMLSGGDLDYLTGDYLAEEPFCTYEPGSFPFQIELEARLNEQAAPVAQA